MLHVIGSDIKFQPPLILHTDVRCTAKSDSKVTVCKDVIIWNCRQVSEHLYGSNNYHYYAAFVS